MLHSLVETSRAMTAELTGLVATVQSAAGDMRAARLQLVSARLAFWHAVMDAYSDEAAAAGPEKRAALLRAVEASRSFLHLCAPEGGEA